MDKLLRETKAAPGYLPEIVPGQYWNPDADSGNGGYEKAHGVNGAAKVLFWSADNTPLLTEEYPGHVNITDRAARELGKVSADNLNIELSALRDAITKTGETAKTLADVVSQLTTMAGGKALSDIVTALGGNLATTLTGSNAALPQLQNKIIIANAVAITTTSETKFNLIDNGGLIATQIRQYKNFKISINGSLNQTATVIIYPAFTPVSDVYDSGFAKLYSEANVLTSGIGRLVFTSDAGGTGGTLKSIPGLKCVHSNLIIGIQCSVAPTSGSVTIVVEMN